MSHNDQLAALLVAARHEAQAATAVQANQAIALSKLDLLLSFLLARYQAASGLTLEQLQAEVKSYAESLNSSDPEKAPAIN